MKKLFFIFILFLVGVAGSVTTTSAQGPCVGELLDELGKDILQDSDGTLDGFFSANGVDGVKAWEALYLGVLLF